MVQHVSEEMVMMITQLIRWHFGDDLDPNYRVPDAIIVFAKDLVSNVHMHYGHLLNNAFTASSVSLGLQSRTAGRSEDEAKGHHFQTSTKPGPNQRPPQ